MNRHPALASPRVGRLLLPAVLLASLSLAVMADTETPPVAELHELQREHRSGSEATEYNLGNGDIMRNHMNRITEECMDLLLNEDGEPIADTEDMMLFVVLDEGGGVMDVVTDPEHAFADCAMEHSDEFLYGKPPEAPWVFGGPME